MAQSKRALPFIILSFVLSVACFAQPQFSINADTLFYGNRPGAQNAVHLWNAGSEALRIDSMHFVKDRYAHGWSIELTPSAQDTVYELGYAFGMSTYGPLPEIELEANDSLSIEIIHFDGCLVCGGKKMGYGDSLFVYSNDATAQPYVVTVDFTFFVSTEEERELGSTTLIVYPNPSRGDVIMEIDARETGSHLLKIYNVLGQQMWEQTKTLVTGQSWQIRWPGRGNRMVRGIYFVTIEANNWQASKSFVVH